MRCFWVSGLFVLTWACGGTHPDFGPDSYAGATSSLAHGGAHYGGSSGTDKAGGDAGGTGGMTSLAPTVQLIQPSAVSDPNDEHVLVSDSAGADTVNVVCQVTASTAKGAAAVDTSSIRIALLDANNKQVQEVPGLSMNSANQYTANFALAKVPAGVVTFRCAASDLAGHSETATISSLLDHGPTITVTSPEPDAAYARQSTVHFAFDVDPAPLADGDEGAAVAEVTLDVNGVRIDTKADARHPHVHSADVDFSDLTQFPPTLTGKVTVDIGATNSRQPKGVERTETYTISLDGAAPTVIIKSPNPTSMIGGQVQLVFTVDDGTTGSGVDLSKLVVLLNDTPYTYDAQNPAWDSDGKGTFSFTFDSTKLAGSISQVTVVVQAWDLAGNGPSQNAQIFLYLDNQAPFVTLTPFQMRAITHSSDGKETYCSSVFNPLGESMADGAIGNRFMRFRAFAWDRTNVAPSQDVIWYSGVDAKHVTLYLQPDSSKPLLLDADGDGTCDSVAPDAKLLPSLILLPVPGQGELDDDPTDFTSTPDASKTYSCTVQKNNAPPLCPDHSSDLSYVIRQNYGNQHNDSSNDAAIYASEVLANSSLCTGGQWEVPPVIKPGSAGADGWLCLTVEARDTVGNVAVAAPLRVCLDDETDNTSPKPPCATSSTPLPSCTDHCKPPPRGRDGDDAHGNPLPLIIEYR